MRPKWQVWGVQFDDRNFAPLRRTLVKRNQTRSGMRAPVRLADLQTRGEALSFLRSTFERQLEASIDANTEPNRGIAGDHGARQAFNALLSPAEQRAFFQQIIADRRYWPRIKSLIGNPPFSFLLPEDEGLLRAGGICRNRAHLSAQDSGISKAPDFGDGHFTDAAERIYRVINHDPKDPTLPWQNLGARQQLVVDVRLKQFAQKTKVAIFRGTDAASPGNQAALMFPRPGEQVVLRLSKHLEGAGAYSVTVRVDSGRQKGRFSRIARLLVTVLESRV
jgi:hypothetical protein